MTLNQIIRSKIEERISTRIKSVSSVSGGCISDAYRITDEKDNQYFLKTNSSSDMFLKEANGLRELSKAKSIRVPEVIYTEKEFILTEYIEQGRKSKSFSEDFGRRFADLHKYKGEQFGFFEDNYIGSNPQLNIPSGNEANSWVEFYFNKRILYQYKLAEKNGYATSDLKDAVSSLEKRIDQIIADSVESPSLLHGDLWGGNYIVDENGDACLIDPAAYYGHREADLAMTKLFGGFSSEFYSAYNEHFPLQDGYNYRENIYKLYHVLNHLNLFGTSYYSQAVSLIKFYLR